MTVPSEELNVVTKHTSGAMHVCSMDFIEIHLKVVDTPQMSPLWWCKEIPIVGWIHNLGIMNVLY